MDEQIPEFMATKSHKNPSADETFKAPIGARSIFDEIPKAFCDSLWQICFGLIRAYL
jgi:hypothetical protein